MSEESLESKLRMLENMEYSINEENDYEEFIKSIDNELINHPVGHVIMAMTLFLDVVGLFLRILQMVQKMTQEKIQNKWK